MKKWGKKGLIILIGLLAAAGFVWTTIKPLEGETVPVLLGDVTSTVTEKGTITTSNSQNIVSELSGKIQEITLDTGAKVTQGQPLGRIDTGDIDTQIAQLEGQLKQAAGIAKGLPSPSNPNQLKELELVLEQAQIAKDLAQENLQRIEELYQAGAATALERDLATGDFQAKEKAWQQAQASLNSLINQSSGNSLQYQGQKESIQAQINYLKNQKLKAKLFAPLAGTILAKNVKTGDYVTPGTILFTIGDLSLLELETYVNSKDMSRVKLNDPVKLIFRLSGEDFIGSGAIDKISPTATEIASALGVMEDKIKINIKLLNTPPGFNLVSGMTVDAEIITNQQKQVLYIPKEAVFRDGKKEFAWLVKNGKATLAALETGMEGDNTIEIKKGLAQNDLVLLDPYLTGLKEGVRIK